MMSCYTKFYRYHIILSYFYTLHQLTKDHIFFFQLFPIFQQRIIYSSWNSNNVQQFIHVSTIHPFLVLPLVRWAHGSGVSSVWLMGYGTYGLFQAHRPWTSWWVTFQSVIRMMTEENITRIMYVWALRHMEADASWILNQTSLTCLGCVNDGSPSPLWTERSASGRSLIGGNCCGCWRRKNRRHTLSHSHTHTQQLLDTHTHCLPQEGLVTQIVLHFILFCCVCSCSWWRSCADSFTGFAHVCAHICAALLQCPSPHKSSSSCWSGDWRVSSANGAKPLQTGMQEHGRMSETTETGAGMLLLLFLFGHVAFSLR